MTVPTLEFAAVINMCSLVVSHVYASCTHQIFYFIVFWKLDEYKSLWNDLSCILSKRLRRES